MTQEIHEPIRPRKRERAGVAGSLAAHSQPLPRVLIRVPYEDTKPAAAESPSTPPGSPTCLDNSKLPSSPVTTADDPPGSALAPTSTTTFRIDAAHSCQPSPHLKPPAWLQQSGGWLASVLQRKTLLATGLIVGVVIVTIAFQQKSTNESVSENARPRRPSKSERHAALQRRTAVESMSSTATQWTNPSKSPSPSKDNSFESTKPRVDGSQSNTSGESSTSGPALTKTDSSTPVVASNVPARVETASNSILGSNDSLGPRMDSIQPPQSVSIQGGEQFYIRPEPVYEARRDAAAGAPSLAPASGANNRAVFDGGPGKLLSK